MPNEAILMCIVGATGVGKTCLVKYLIQSNEVTDTNKLAYIKQWDSVIVGSNTSQRFRIWDLNGKVCKTEYASLYYSQCQIILLTYCINSISSYEFAKTLWRTIKSVTIHNPTLEIVLIGLKSDMEEEREVSVPEARQFATVNQLQFYEVSILSGNEIKRLKSDIATLLSSTEAERVNLKIQACVLHLEHRRLKQSGENSKERIQEIQDLLRRNQYDVQYYKCTEKQLQNELNTLKQRYLGVINENSENSYQFFV